MSVVLTPSSFEHPHPSTDPRCVMCSGRLHPPFIVWRSESLVYICGDCGQDCATGLMADLIHLKAIKDIKRLYPPFTLERQEQSRLQARQKRENDAFAVAPQKWKLP